MRGCAPGVSEQVFILMTLVAGGWGEEAVDGVLLPDLTPNPTNTAV